MKCKTEERGSKPKNVVRNGRTWSVELLCAKASRPKVFHAFVRITAESVSRCETVSRQVLHGTWFMEVLFTCVKRAGVLGIPKCLACRRGTDSMCKGSSTDTINKLSLILTNYINSPSEALKQSLVSMTNVIGNAAPSIGPLLSRGIEAIKSLILNRNKSLTGY